MKTRVVFLGNDAWSTPSLEALASSQLLEVGLVVTNPPRPAGRGSELRATDVSLSARKLGLNVVEIERVGGGEGLAALRAAVPDALVVVAYGELLTAEVLAIPPLGSVNLHFSLLPRWRGASPVQRALLAGDEVTGVTVMLMDDGLDTGPALGAVEEAILPDDDAGSLGARLARVGARLLVDRLVSLAEGSAEPTPQQGDVTLAPKLTSSERWIDWSDPAIAVVRRVRALSPEPGASTRADGEILKVFKATVEEGHQERSEPGSIAAVDREGIVVATGEGSVRLLEVAAAGHKRMPSADWARGARPTVGSPLG